MEKEKLKSTCIECNQYNWHSIEGKHSFVTHPDHDYHSKIEHMVVKCCGCDNISFLQRTHDFESSYYEQDIDDWITPISDDIYPKQLKGCLQAKNFPTIVKKIYIESCQAYRDESYTLAGIGFRATIEAVCNDQAIQGKELSVRINNLASKGLISKKDSVRLHSIRFLGNDAAHDIKVPSEEALEATLIIIEHLLNTIYILDHESKGKLEEIIDDFDLFLKLLDAKLLQLKKDEELPLQAILGKEIRRISGSIKKIEKKLNTEIGKGAYQKLAFGKTEKYKGSTESLLHYIVQ
ncbi:DUF4145 domain-containing protein [Aeromonas hydrophila]|uniref:DUF4145 domain-containing protein n=1 Tax=Aeromonas hydrophila TaxID=644 RepID=UPI002B49BC6D|nr:DUF4145 domain-containing protein [Aeromonas hydrophila]